ncbi:hypothetical magnesium chelatase [Mycobacterium tuberculosis EAS054]|nr:hypothetical magnesium chelatase [Mycobacterium tuberculosis EAS054]
MKPYPFSAIVGHDRLRLALLLCAVRPEIGGALIRGEKGTAKIDGGCAGWPRCCRSRPGAPRPASWSCRWGPPKTGWLARWICSG